MTKNVLTRMGEPGETTLGHIMSQKMRGDSTISFVEKLLRENLDIPPATELHIETAQKALAPKPASTETRSRVIKFHHYETKEDIQHKAWI